MPERRPYSITPEQIAAAQALRAEGLTHATIAAMFDVSRSTIRYWTTPAVREKAKADRLVSYAKNRERMLAYGKQYHHAKRKLQTQARKANGNSG